MQVAGNIPRGELVLALVFAALGILWVAVAAGLPMWEGFAPQSGDDPQKAERNEDKRETDLGGGRTRLHQVAGLPSRSR